MGIDKHEQTKKGGALKRFEMKGPRIWLPLSVLQGAAYAGLSMSAKALLIDLAAQLRAKHGNIINNGDLTTAFKVLSKTGWNSDKTIRTAASLLEERYLIVKTRQGCLPNKANLYAVTWLPLNEHSKLDVSGQNFPLNRFLLLDKAPEVKNRYAEVNE